ncbi:hypothetical protein MYCTH_2113368 [Thermothelomyces thermophilus ATCC 42464]|uniref:Uncharacterized protein n=1 Tax=Thermothelomyces thermophilus (strain ATCC 42464 / BCRC 31852 / DSM 1799) TaxID=573729 RepID=G2QPD9_THET4|nr:uncharacterized protein MYCTH_2113368 [Thermothelomyces thermophilus ATCC 42464]AEO61452.1 hypothetical protein MYCTH_2113368 [Thermothelomyces thermophilus ATCC 42464]
MGGPEYVFYKTRGDNPRKGARERERQYYYHIHKGKKQQPPSSPVGSGGGSSPEDRGGGSSGGVEKGEIPWVLRWKREAEEQGSENRETCPDAHVFDAAKPNRTERSEIHYTVGQPQARGAGTRKRTKQPEAGNNDGLCRRNWGMNLGLSAQQGRRKCEGPPSQSRRMDKKKMEAVSELEHKDGTDHRRAGSSRYHLERVTNSPHLYSLDNPTPLPGEMRMLHW